MSTNLAILLSCILFGIGITHITNNMLEKNNSNSKIKSAVSIFLISLITFFSYKIKYSAESNLFRILLYIVAFKLIHNKTLYKTIISVIITMIILACCDIISSLIFINFLTADEMRGIWYWILICNMVVCIMTCTVASIKPIKNKLRNFTLNINENGILSSIVLFLMFIIVIISLFYNISKNYQWSEKYIINVIISITYFTIIIIFLKDKREYNNLIMQYDCLFEYFKELENSIDDISLLNHEYKNQLSVLKSYIKNNQRKAAINYIDDIINTGNIEDKTLITELKNIPKGGLKGLLYYKIITAKNKKVKIVVDASNRVKKHFEQLTTEENRVLSKIIGVYLDNAVEEVAYNKNKIVNIEFYTINNEINIVISNPISKKNININNIKQKGYTTKGKGRGKGLYLIGKIISKNKYIETETRIIKKYFIQKIVIKK